MRETILGLLRVYPFSILLLIIATHAFILAILWPAGLLALFIEESPAHRLVPLNGHPAALAALLGPTAADSTTVAGTTSSPAETAAEPEQEPAHVSPVAAVVVRLEQMEALPEVGISSMAQSSLEQGLRLALLAGAPWVVVTGTARECAAGAAYLRGRMRDTMSSLFGDYSFREWIALKRAYTIYDHSIVWDCLMRSAAELGGLDQLGEVPVSFRHAEPPEGLTGDRESRLRDGLASSPTVGHLPATTRAIAAWLVAAAVERRGHSACRDETDVMVYGRGRDAAGGSAAPPTASASTLWRWPRLWTVPEPIATRCRTHSEAGSNRSTAGVPPRLILPGILLVPMDDVPARDVPMQAARAIGRALEGSVLARLRAGDSEGWWPLRDPYRVLVVSPTAVALRTRVRFQAAFRRARVEALGGIREGVAVAARGVAGGQRWICRPNIADVLPAFFRRAGSLRGGLSRRLGSWSSVTAVGPRVMIAPPCESVMGIRSQELPHWLSFRDYAGMLAAATEGAARSSARTAAMDPLTGDAVVESVDGGMELPPHSRERAARVSLLDDGTAPPDAMRLTVWLGRYAHYLYYNYRRVCDNHLERMATTGYHDGSDIIWELASDAAQGVIHWSDFLAQ